MAIFAPPLRRTLQELRDDSEDRVWRRDIRSTGWDGGTDLSSVDTAATKGYFVDFSADAAQFETLFHKGADLGVWKTWTPTWTNLTVGNGTVVARYVQIGDTVIAYLSIVLGSTSAVSGTVSVTLPVNEASTYASDGSEAVGQVQFIDATSTDPVGRVALFTSNRVVIQVYNASATYTAVSNLSSTVPFTWTTSDAIFTQFTFEAA